METKKKQYKPGQIITLNIEGVNHRYRIKQVKCTHGIFNTPACIWCEFTGFPADSHPCSKLCINVNNRKIPFKTMEEGRMIPDDCYLIPIS